MAGPWCISGHVQDSHLSVSQKRIKLAQTQGKTFWIVIQLSVRMDYEARLANYNFIYTENLSFYNVE